MSLKPLGLLARSIDAIDLELSATDLAQEDYSSESDEDEHDVMANPMTDKEPSQSAISDARVILRSLEKQSGIGSTRTGNDMPENVESMLMTLEKVASGGTGKGGINNELMNLVSNVKDIRKTEGVGEENSETPISSSYRVDSEMHFNNVKGQEKERTALTGNTMQKSLRFNVSGPKIFPTEMNADIGDEDPWTECRGDPWSKKMADEEGLTSSSSSSAPRKSLVTAGSTSETSGTTLTGTLTRMLSEQDDKIIRDRLDIEYLFMKAEEEKKEYLHVQTGNKIREEEKIKLLEEEENKLLEEEKTKLLEEEKTKLLEEEKTKLLGEVKETEGRVKEKLLEALKERKEAMCKLEEENNSLWAASRELAPPAEETVVVETQAERFMLTTPSTESARRTWRRTRPDERSGEAKEESLISSIRSEASHQRHPTPKKRVVREEVQEAASRRLAYDIAVQEETKDPDAAKIPLKRFKSRFKFGERRKPTTADAMVGTKVEDREIGTQTEVSLPRRTEVIWNCHISGTHAVLDIPEMEPTVDELLVEDQCNIGESVTTDPRPMEMVNEGVDTECQYYNMDREESAVRSPDKTDHSMFDFDELDAMEPGGDEHQDAANPGTVQDSTRAGEFDEFTIRATDEGVFARGDEMRQRYRLMELERVTEDVKRVQSGISDHEATEITEASRRKRLREYRAPNGRIIVRCGTMGGHTAQEAIDEYNAERKARSPGTEATTETMESTQRKQRLRKRHQMPKTDQCAC